MKSTFFLIFSLLLTSIGFAQTEISPSGQVTLYPQNRLEAMSFSPYSGYDGTVWDRERVYFGTFEPWPFVPGDIYGWPWMDQVKNPIGHEIRPDGKGGYSYGPVYARDPWQPQPTVAPPAKPSEVEKANEVYKTAMNAFQEQRYSDAALLFQQLMVTRSNSELAPLMLAQAKFAEGEFLSAGEQLADALTKVAPSRWGEPVKQYRELYPQVRLYSQQIKALQEFVKLNSDKFSAQLLIGYHYGYLGYRQDAIKHLRLAQGLSPENQVVAKLLQQFE